MFVRRHRALAIAALLIGLLLVGGVVSTSIALLEVDRQRRNAELATDVARSNGHELALELRRSQALNETTQSFRVLSTDPVLALRLALEGAERHRSPETVGHLQVVLAGQFLQARFHGHQGSITAGDIGARTGRILTADEYGSVCSWTMDGEALWAVEQGGNVVSAKFTQDEQSILTIVASDTDHRVARRVGADGQLLDELGAAGEFSSCAWNQDGDWILVRHAGPGVLAILDREGKEIRRLQERSEEGEVQVLPGGFAVHGTRQELRIWPPERDLPIVLRRTDGMEVFAPLTRALSVDPRGELFATVHLDRAHLWSREGYCIASLDEHTYFVTSACFSPSGDTILTTSGDGRGRLWSREGRRLAVLHQGDETLGGSFYGSDHRIIVWSSHSVAYQTSDGRELARLTCPEGLTVVKAVDAPSGRVLATGGAVAGLWNLAGSCTQHMRGDVTRPWATVQGPGGEILFSSEQGHVVLLERAGEKRTVYTTGPETHSATGATYGVSMSPDGQRIAAGGRGALFVWDRGHPNQSRRYGLQNHVALTDVHFVGSGDRVVATAAPGGVAFLFDLESGTRTILRGREEGFAHRVFVSPDRNTFFITARKAGTWMFDAEGRRQGDWSEGTGVSNVAFHPRHPWVAIARRDGRVQIWNLDDLRDAPSRAKPLRTIEYDVSTSNIAFSPVEDLMIVTSARNARLMDLEGRLRYLVPVDPREKMGGFFSPFQFFSPDGRWVIGTAYDGAQRWLVHEDDLLRAARTLLDRVSAPGK